MFKKILLRFKNRYDHEQLNGNDLLFEKYHLQNKYNTMKYNNNHYNEIKYVLLIKGRILIS